MRFHMVVLVFAVCFILVLAGTLRQRWSGVRQELLDGVASGDVAAVERALAAGTPVDASDAFGRTPLWWACMYGHEQVAASLIAHGANIEAENCGLTPLMLAAGNGDWRTMELLIRKHATVDRVNEVGDTSLALAAGHGHQHAVEVLLAAGANANSRNPRGETPLGAAAGEGYAAIVRTLLAAGADPNLADNAGRTPQMLAAASGHKEIAEILKSGEFSWENPAMDGALADDTRPVTGPREPDTPPDAGLPRPRK